MKKFLILCIALIAFTSAAASAKVKSIYVEQVDWNEVCVAFSSSDSTCTVHWKRFGTSTWHSYHCDFGDGTFNIRLQPGAYDFRVTVGNSGADRMFDGKGCSYTVTYGGPQAPSAVPRRRGPPPPPTW